MGWLSTVIRKLQSGYIYNYAFAMIFGILLLMTMWLCGPSPLSHSPDSVRMLCSAIGSRGQASRGAPGSKCFARCSIA